MPKKEKQPLQKSCLIEPNNNYNNQDNIEQDLEDQWNIDDLVKADIIHLCELKAKLNQALIKNQPILEIKDLHRDIEWILKPFSDSSNVVCQNLKIQVLESQIELVIKSASKKLKALYLKRLIDELSLCQQKFQAKYKGDRDE